ncbi:acyl-CoA dehydrogenase family protein [Kordiimonas marina]|uniref:acyl-CoA dehydrogenase family protein n=1 Tax=Kordiimonas marina TaxID=2872312 RepID=UPI001FF3519F|nr:acyl-CoA dehydrogenase family protein [Kordiimonas marina]MCJ9430665.1 acyl-CoA dehydrogenase family protein [Kordiimonas marina]
MPVSENPRSQLATHEVTNQPTPFGDRNVFSGDAIARDYVTHALGTVADAAAKSAHLSHLQQFGSTVGCEEAREHGRLANESLPKLTPFDRYGHRIDEVEFHPSYHALMDMGLSGGVSSRAWTHKAGGHVAHTALMTLMTWADAGVTCPMSMTYAVSAVLQDTDWTRENWFPAVTSGIYDPAVKPLSEKRGATMGMAMTEKQGGSDVRANSTRATAIPGTDDEVQLLGHKWFCSAPMCDGFLTLAYEDAGLSCFLVPRWRPDGSRNAMEIQRLKDKLGDRSNASSEIEYRNAWARRVGEPGRGVKTIINMVHHTRLDCAAGSAANMRIGLALAAHHATGRSVFQKKLVDQPLMQATLSDMTLEVEAAYALLFEEAAAFDKAAAGDEDAAMLSRILAPVAKYWICKRAPALSAEAMECHGGVGYVEETGMPRLFRQSPLNSIWEGSGNVIALDIQRALMAPPVLAALQTRLSAHKGADGRLDQMIGRLLNPKGFLDQGEAGLRAFSEKLALVLQATALMAGPESALADAFIRTRIAAPALAFGGSTERLPHDLLMGRAVIAA